MSEPISIKGTREGLTVTMGAGDLAPIMADLRDRLQTQGAFFRGGHIALHLNNRSLSEPALRQLRDMFSEYDMVLRTVVSDDHMTQSAAFEMGLRVIEPSAKDVPETPQPITQRLRQERQAPPSLDGSKGVLLRHVVRSGQIIRHTGHIVVLGDVNAGAELIAGGDIIVWGRLQGIAHAGSMGNHSAVICALQMTPLQLRIGNYIARPGEGDESGDPIPEMASVRDEAIIVEPWYTPR